MDSVSGRPGSSELPPAAVSGGVHHPATEAQQNVRLPESELAVTIAPQKEDTTLDKKIATIANNKLSITTTNESIRTNYQLKEKKEQEIETKSQEIKTISTNRAIKGDIIAAKTRSLMSEIQELNDTIKNLNNDLIKNRKALYNLQEDTAKLVRDLNKLIDSKAKESISQGYYEFQGTAGDERVLARMKELDSKGVDQIYNNSIDREWGKLKGKDDAAIESGINVLSRVNPKAAGAVLAKLFDASPELAKKIFKENNNIDFANAFFENATHIPPEKLTTLLPHLAKLEVSRDVGSNKDATRFRGDDAIGNFQNQALKREFISVFAPGIRNIFMNAIKFSSEKPTQIQKLRSELAKAEQERTVATDKWGAAKSDGAREVAKKEMDAAQNKIDGIKKQLNAIQPQLALEILRATTAAIKSDRISPDVKAFLREAVQQARANGFANNDRQAVSIVVLRIINPLLMDAKQLGLELGSDELKTAGGIGVVLQREALKQTQREDLEPLMDAIRPEMQKLFDAMAESLVPAASLVPIDEKTDR